MEIKVAATIASNVSSVNLDPNLSQDFQNIMDNGKFGLIEIKHYLHPCHDVQIYTLLYCYCFAIWCCACRN